MAVYAGSFFWYRIQVGQVASCTTHQRTNSAVIATSPDPA
jgi:hypothetical protein